jgi:hypothetical protein
VLLSVRSVALVTSLALAALGAERSVASSATDVGGIAARNRGTLTTPLLERDTTSALIAVYARGTCATPKIAKMNVAYVDTTALPWLEARQVDACGHRDTWMVEFTPTSDGGADYRLEPPHRIPKFDAAGFEAAHGGTLAQPDMQRTILAKIQAGSQRFDRCAATVQSRRVVYFHDIFTTWFEHWTVADCAKTRVWTITQRLNDENAVEYDITTEK